MADQPITSYRGLATRFNRSVSSAHRWSRHADWPASPRPPWTARDVKKIRRFVAALGSDRPGASPELRQARLRLLQEQFARLRLDREQLLARHVLREDVESDLAGQVAAVTTGCDWLAGRVTRAIRGVTDETEIERLTLAECRRLAAVFAGVEGGTCATA